MTYADHVNRRAEIERETPGSSPDRLTALVAARHVSIRDRRGAGGLVIRDGNGRVTREVWGDGDMIGERRTWAGTRALALRVGELVAAGDLVRLADIKRAEMDRESKRRDR